MIKFEDECCGCATESYPCLGNSCPNRNVPHFYCDDCDSEETLYDFEDAQLCSTCVIARLKVIEGSDW